MQRWLVCVALIGCASQDPVTAETQTVSAKPSKKCHPHKKHSDCGSTTATIGVSGGTITTDTGATLSIPYGAVDANTTITVNTTDIAAPSGAPEFEFEPEGTVFAKPLTVTLPVPAGTTTASVYWSQLGSTTAFDAIGGTIVSGQITAQTFHFSLAYVGPDTTLRTVEGGGSTTWISASGRESVKTDFSAAPVDIIYGDGSGGFVTRRAAPDGAGLFKLDGVPDGEYIVHSGKSWLVTSSSLPDLGSTKGGGNPDSLTRPRRFFQDGESSQLTLNLSNLAAWDPNDQLEWFSTEPDDWDFDSERFANITSPTTASLAFDVTWIDGTTLGPAEIRGDLGDHTTLGQLVENTTTSGVSYLAMQRIAQFPAGFTARAAQSQTLDLALTDVSTGNSLSIDYRGSQWKHVLDTYGNPAAQGPGTAACPQGLCGGFAGALGQAGGAADGFYTANADLLLMFDSTGFDAVTGAMHYADPAALGGTWGVIFDARWSKRTLVQIPDTVGRARRATFGFVDAVEWTTTVANAQAAPVVPLVLPPANITVNGTPFFSGGGDVGTTPTIAWTNPNTGSIQPAVYTIAVNELFVDDLDRTSAGPPIATINTPDTSITLPPGITQPGHDYVFTITATAPTSPAASTSLATSPLKSSIDIATATVSSGLFGTLRGTPAAQVIEDNQNFPLGTAANATNVFWIERGQAPWDPPGARNAGNIWTANLDGSNPHILASGIDEPLEIAAIGNTIYWLTEGDGTGGSGGLWSMDLSTSSISFIASGSNPNGMMVYGSDLYWMGGEGIRRLRAGTVTLISPDAGGNLTTDGTSLFLTRGDQVDSMPIDGGALTTLVGGQANAWQIFTDGAYLYWSNQNFAVQDGLTIDRMPIAGGAPETLVTGNEIQKWFAMDAANIYTVHDGFVWAIAKTGGGPQKLAALNGSPGCPQDQLTIAAGALYFTDTCGSMATYRVALP